MKMLFRILLLAGICVSRLCAQPQADDQFTVIGSIGHTPVKNQASTGTCWSFATVSLVESEAIRKGIGSLDLSEMFIVRNIYIDKAKNYVLRQGVAQFGQGGLGHDVVDGISRYGAMPESAYSGLLLGNRHHDHGKLESALKSYLDSLLRNRPLPSDWLDGFQHILDEHLGKVPATFTYNERVYTPETFASEVLKFRKEDFVFLTSFSHHPFYQPFIVEIPDNYLNQAYFNIPLEEMIGLVKTAVRNGYSVMWDADVSNKHFSQKNAGFAMIPANPAEGGSVDPDTEEIKYDQHLRQRLFENLTTQDDHLMHIVGLEKTKKGKEFFLVKNSWGEIGPFKGYIRVSDAYFAINTITLVVPKMALPVPLRAKLGVE